MPASDPAAVDPRPRLDLEQVVDAAVAIVDADGLPALTLARVATALGVRTPSLYHHVAGLDGVRRAVALRGLREIGTTLRDAAIGLSGPEALAAMADAYRAYALAHPGVYAAAQRVNDRQDVELRAAATRTTEVVFAIVRHWEADEERLVHLVRSVRSALHGFVTLETGGGFGMSASRDASFALLVRLQVAGLDALGGRARGAA